MRQFGKEFKFYITEDERDSGSPESQLLREFGQGSPIFMYESGDYDDLNPFVYTDKELSKEQLSILQACLKYNWDTYHLNTKTALRCLKNREYCDNLFISDHHWREYRQFCEESHGVFAWADNRDIEQVEIIFQEWKVKKGY